jgi:protein phosphatase
MRKLMGKPVQVRHGLAESLAQLEGKPPEFLQEIISFIDSRVSHYLLDNGQLVVAHAGMKQELQGRGSGKVRDFALYGETTGETDEFGFPIRYNWAAEYRGKAMVVYGHTPIPEAEWLNNTINIDTGCVFGGKLTALRYPEKELVSIAAEKVYFASTKPLVKENKNGSLSAQQQHDDILDIADVLGKRIISTRLYRNITIRAEQAIAALEVMSRFAANPKWLIYLSPTMSPCETTHQPGLLEHPAEAFAYYRHQGVPIVVCEEKHMGSRAVIIICRNAEAASKYFGVNTGEIGICYTRTGRRFFDDSVLERELLNRIQTALTITDSWEKFQTEWVCLDCELMPWSAKAQELIRQQYAAVGIAARSALAETVNVLAQVEARGIELVKHHGIPLTAYYQQRATMVKDYVEAYRHYCWPIHSINDFKIAPFHLLATTSGVNIHNNHIWHMDTLAEICQADNQLLFATPYQLVDVTDEKSQQQGIEWWQQLTAGGGEGMVVKPLDFAVKGEHGLVQPAIKCRGKEYLRIIYGPEYSATENLSRLRARSLATKRALALREFALGIEALERFVRQEPLRRVHECSFGILALESEPVDPRL